MSSARKHLRNLAFNWGGHASTLLVMFFLSPYIVGKLDAVSYGIWSLLSVLTGYMGIFDLGVRASVGRHVALYLGKDDPVGVDETIRAGFGFFSLVGGLILLVGIGLGWLFPSLFKGISPENYDTVRILLPLMVVNVWLSAIAAIYSSVLAAHDRFDLARIVDMTVLIVRTIGTIYALEMGWGLWGLALSIFLSSLVATILNNIYAKKILPYMKSFPLFYSKKRFKELFGYGLGAFVTNASIKIIGQSNLVVVGIFLSVSDVREYSVGSMIVIYSTTFLNIICATYFPSIQRNAAINKNDAVLDLFYKQLNVSLIFGFLTFIGFFVYSKYFIYNWMMQDGFGLDSVVSSAGVMGILALSRLPTLYTMPCIGVLSALGNIGFTAKVSICEALLNLFFSILIIKIFNIGIIGVAIGTLIARICSSLFIPVFLLKKLSIKKYDFFKKIILPTSVAAIVFFIVSYYQVKFFEPYGWYNFSLNIFICLILWTLICFIFIFKCDYKKIYRTMKN